MKPGLYANIHAKQERIKRQKAEGKPVERMRKPGNKGRTDCCSIQTIS